jgi:hypothetical protein
MSQSAVRNSRKHRHTYVVFPQTSRSTSAPSACMGYARVRVVLYTCEVSNKNTLVPHHLLARARAHAAADGQVSIPNYNIINAGADIQVHVVIDIVCNMRTRVYFITAYHYVHTTPSMTCVPPHTRTRHHDELVSTVGTPAHISIPPLTNKSSPGRLHEGSWANEYTRKSDDFI